MKLDVLHLDHPERNAVIDYVHRKFAEVYGADLKSYMPHFIRVRDWNGRYKTVMGYRDAEHHPLFLEHYLDAPIEEMIGRYVGHTVERKSIVEVGNMAEDQPGDARLAIIAATAFFHTIGYQWVVFTGVGRLRNAFRRLGLDPKELMEADESLLPEEERKRWGSYYQGRPVICFGDIGKGHDNLQELWAMLRDTWASAVEEGEIQRDSREARA